MMSFLGARVLAHPVSSCRSTSLRHRNSGGELSFHERGIFGDRVAGQKPTIRIVPVLARHGSQCGPSNFATVDAGLKALYRDGGIPRIVDPLNAGTFEWFGDEYGKITPASPVRTFSVGQKLRLSLSHCDPTVNLFDVLFATDGDIVVDVYPIDLRGRSQ